MTKAEVLANFQVIKDQIEHFGEVFFDESDIPMIDSVIELLTADVAPVVHGEWIVKGQEVYCSKCKKTSGYNWHGASAFSNYCPNCGAKMDLR